MLSLRDVHVHIGKLHILQGVNLEVNTGESAALLGRNGVARRRRCARSWVLHRAAAGRSNLTASISQAALPT